MALAPVAVASALCLAYCLHGASIIHYKPYVSIDAVCMLCCGISWVLVLSALFLWLLVVDLMLWSSLVCTTAVQLCAYGLWLFFYKEITSYPPAAILQYSPLQLLEFNYHCLSLDTGVNKQLELLWSGSFIQSLWSATRSVTAKKQIKNIV